MNILVSGSTGLIGRALIPSLTAQGHTVRRLVRGSAQRNDVSWDPPGHGPAVAGLEGTDIIIHLAGEPISGRWTEAKKKMIRMSRSEGTRCLVESILKMSRPPQLVISASATGYYGNRGADALTEESHSGQGFLAEVCRDWEAALDPIRAKAIPTVHLRLGIILSRDGGALAKMLPPFRLGLGGPAGRGDQYMSWIALDDVIGVIGYIIKNDTLRGALNVTAPEPVTNAEFAKMLGRVLNRPAVIPIPGLAIKVMFGEMGEALLLGGARVLPARLTRSTFQFRYRRLEDALHHLLKR